MRYLALLHAGGPYAPIIVAVFFAIILGLLVAIACALLKRVVDSHPELFGKDKKKPKD